MENHFGSLFLFNGLHNCAGEKKKPCTLGCMHVHTGYSTPGLWCRARAEKPVEQNPGQPGIPPSPAGGTSREEEEEEGRMEAMERGWCRRPNPAESKESCMAEKEGFRRGDGMHVNACTVHLPLRLYARRYAFRVGVEP